MHIVILRGAPGSGKSTYARKHYPKYTKVSADDYMVEDQVYKFDPAKLQRAHNACKRKFLEALDAEEDIVVDNTNIYAIDVAFYAEAAMAMGAFLEILTLEIRDCDIAANRNIHGVPPVKVQAMWIELSNQEHHFPARWRHTKIKQEDLV